MAWRFAGWWRDEDLGVGNRYVGLLELGLDEVHSQDDSCSPSMGAELDRLVVCG